ncbi:type II toxin-antitoxin system RelE family toxin [Dyadobacter sp. 50-39]|uniref:type II toxin-antitoxin system RelE family toxin n=1 Tax=Dyadobacter sp. 50-39 TaxID=1895756 RepID=UPI0038D40AFD
MKFTKSSLTIRREKISESFRRRKSKKIVPAIRSLANEPRPPGCKKLVDTNNSYRVRVGNYRILYCIEDRVRIVEVSAVKHRREAYE